MSARRVWLPLGAALILGAGGAALPFVTPARADSTPAAADTMGLAVVDYQSLLKNHPDYEKLKQLDEQLDVLEQEKVFIPLADQKAARDEASKRMEAEVEKAKAELEAERNRIEGELSGLSQSLAAQMNGEMSRLRSTYEAKIKEGIQQVRPPEQQLTDSGNQSVREYLSNLQLIRERNLATRRIEIERSVRAELESERQKLDSEAAAYEDQVGGQYQEEKLNLQLKLQVTSDEEEQQKLQERLDTIASEISSKKSAKRDELDRRFQAYRSERQAFFEKEMSSYQRKLDLEVQEKLGRKRTELGGNPATSVPVPPDIQAKIKDIESRLRGEMQAKEAALKAQMESRASQARAQLEAKQNEVQERLKATEEEVRRLFEARVKNVSKQAKEKLEAVDKKIEKVKAERKELYQHIADDLNKVVGEVAVKKEVPMVIGRVVYNRDLPDLTDLSMVALKQQESH